MGVTTTTLDVSWRRTAITRQALFVASCLVAIYGLTLFSVAFRPNGLDWAAWWPAAGITVGLLARYSGARAIGMSLAVVVATTLGNVVAGRPLALAIAFGIVGGLEAFAASRFLRAPGSDEPRLDTMSDLGRLFAAVGTAVIVSGFGAGLAGALVLGPSHFLPILLAAAPSHAAGILLISPLFFEVSSDSSAAKPVEAVAQWCVTATVILLAFGLNTGMSLAFLALGPLVWGAARLSRLAFMAQLLLTAIAISMLTSYGYGAFAVGQLPPVESAFMVQVWDVSSGLVLFTVMTIVGVQRDLSISLRRSQRLLQDTIRTSSMGIGVLRSNPSAISLEDLNPAGESIFGSNSFRELRRIVDSESFVRLAQALGSLNSTGDGGTGVPVDVTTADGRVLATTVSRLPTRTHDSLYSFQFVDITDRARLEEAQLAEMQRAAEVQQALLPKMHLEIAGYQIAGGCTPTRAVGGDFYDWQCTGEGMSFSLGDVMGKGVGAAMIAASLRVALRGSSTTEPASALANAAESMQADLSATSSFATLFHANLRAHDGLLRFADAGHGLTFIVRANGTLRHLSSRDTPLGILDDQEWAQQSVHLGYGDTLITFSDGLLDLFDSTLSTIRAVAGLVRSAETAEDIIAAIAGLTNEVGAPDDVTALVLRRTVPVDAAHSADDDSPRFLEAKSLV